MRRSLLGVEFLIFDFQRIFRVYHRIFSMATDRSGRSLFIITVLEKTTRTGLFSHSLDLLFSKLGVSFKAHNMIPFSWHSFEDFFFGTRARHFSFFSFLGCSGRVAVTKKDLYLGRWDGKSLWCLDGIAVFSTVVLRLLQTF